MAVSVFGVPKQESTERTLRPCNLGGSVWPLARFFTYFLAIRGLAQTLLANKPYNIPNIISFHLSRRCS